MDYIKKEALSKGYKIQKDCKEIRDINFSYRFPEDATKSRKKQG